MGFPAASAITMALNSPTASIDIHAGVAGPGKGSAGFIAAANQRLGLLPTPPNSISPNLPAQALRAGIPSPPPVSLERDLDLQEAVEHAKAQDQPNMAAVPLSKEALSGLEREQIITPAMLAREYLPGIMLGHGDMAIRHIMGCLNHDVSGFSKIEPARARRIVVAALESRAGGGPDGSVQFMKVGWGRWLAHGKGQKSASRPISSTPRASRPSPAPSDASFAASYTGTSYATSLRYNAQGRGMALGQSYPGSDMPSVDEGLEDMSLSDDEVDNMSIDGSDSDDSASDGAGDETDEEDWAAIGAAALRRRASKPAVQTGSLRRNYNLLCISSPVNTRRLSTSGSVTKPFVQRTGSSTPYHSGSYIQRNNFNAHNSPSALGSSVQEQDAARALLSLGSL